MRSEFSNESFECKEPSILYHLRHSAPQLTIEVVVLDSESSSLSEDAHSIVVKGLDKTTLAEVELRFTALFGIADALERELTSYLMRCRASSSRHSKIEAAKAAAKAAKKQEPAATLEAVPARTIDLMDELPAVIDTSSDLARSSK